MPGKMPSDASGKTMPLTFPDSSLATTVDATISSSTQVTLQPLTSLIEVSAISQGIFMKWGATASSTSFDEFIAAGFTRQYKVKDNATTVNFIEQAASATLILIEKQ